MALYNFENKLFIREEVNGVTVYFQKLDGYFFFKGISFSHLKELKTYNEVVTYLKSRASLLSKDIDFQLPFRVNWLIEEKCNLDCIYCFANDKMKNKIAENDYLSTVEQITSLNILCVGLTGGEPTLNPKLIEIIDKLSNRCLITLDTNGTTSFIKDNYQLLKRASVLVRVSIDSLRDATINCLRPARNGSKQSDILIRNIKILIKENIPFLVHTVVTQNNIKELKSLAKKLAALGVSKWHLYGVHYSQKCAAIYEQIKVTKDELIQAYRDCCKLYGSQMEISYYIDENAFSANSIVLVDSNGKFYVDSVKNGIAYIGDNPKKPTSNDFKKFLDIKMHCEGYLKDKDILSAL